MIGTSSCQNEKKKVWNEVTNREEEKKWRLLEGENCDKDAFYWKISDLTMPNNGKGVGKGKGKGRGMNAQGELTGKRQW